MCLVPVGMEASWWGLPLHNNIQDGGNSLRQNAICCSRQRQNAESICTPLVPLEAELLMKHHLLQHSCKTPLTSSHYSRPFNIILTVANYHPCCFPQTPEWILASSFRLPPTICCILWRSPFCLQCSSHLTFLIF
jgi:hypothetical protein